MPELDINISNKPVKELSNDVEMVYGATNSRGEKFLVKLVNIEKAYKLGIASCLEYNKEVLLNNVDTPAFPEHLLRFTDELQNKQIMGVVSEYYETTLFKYMYSVNISEREALDIFNHVLKAIYSITMMGYLHKNIRPAHFVKCGKLWKLQSLVESQVYEQSNGASSVYIWDPKYQAPETSTCQFTDEDFKQMIVWNCGSLLLDLLMGGHRLSTKEVLDKFKGQEFTFQAIGISKTVSGKFSEGTKALLGKLLHYDPNKRMKLLDMFLNICPQIAEHYKENKTEVPVSKIHVPQSSRIASLNMSSTNALKEIGHNFALQQKNKNNVLRNSNLHNLQGEDEFIGNLAQISYRFKKQEQGEVKKVQSIDKLVVNKNHPIRRAFELYKSYYDQSELLMVASEVMEQLEFINIKDPKDIKEIKLLIKYAVTFVSLINLNFLAEGFNQNKNILEFDADLFTEFQESTEYNSFKDFINFKRTERSKLLDSIRNEVGLLKNKYFCKQNPMVSDMLTYNYKNTQFNKIKSAYRFIVKYAYDSICEQYNQQKQLKGSSQLARMAMYVTYCLTIDKLYIREEIPDNFKFYFEWLGRPATSYVPLVQFKNYIEKAPKQNLIENSRFILKKYYNI